YGDEDRQRVALPTYPFERQRYWIDPPAAGTTRAAAARLRKRPEVADWLYLPSWKRALSPGAWSRAAHADEPLRWLVLLDDTGLGQQVIEQLRLAGHEVITVCAGQRFTRRGELDYLINPHVPQEYDLLLEAIEEDERVPDTILHLWNITAHDQPTSPGADLEQLQTLSFLSVLSLTQALARHDLLDDLELVAVTNRAYAVTEEDDLRVDQASLLGACKVIPQEYPGVSCRAIDIVLPHDDAPRLSQVVDQLVAEITSGSPDRVVAYRGRHRWIPTFEPLDPDAGGGVVPWLRPGGTYLVVNGLEQPGHVFAEYLARTAQATLVLIDEAALPMRARWDEWLATHHADDPISRKIRGVQELERLGATVAVLQADTTDLAQMQAAIQSIDDRFGALHGVIQTDGRAASQAFRAILETDREQWQWLFRRKVQATLVLEAALEGRVLDVCLLQSSLSSILGGLGLIAHTAASATLDAIAHRQSLGSSVPWISINWDSWSLEHDREQPRETSLTEFSITRSEALAALDYIFRAPRAPQLIVSTGDLRARIERWIGRAPIEQSQAQGVARVLHPRPGLLGAYVAPRTDLEHGIAAIWQAILGIERIGVHDNFFELGGHSLLITQLASRLRETFLIDPPLRALFEAPTIAGFADVLTEHESVPGQVAAIARLHRQIDAMSTDQIQAALADRKQAGRQP
ncbi:MAG TPA: KR domain-containing protein, partial [Herpetosiphonaceae bacterium]